MNNGTHEGDDYEINFVRSFNKNKTPFKEYLDAFTENPLRCWMVRVTTKQYSSLSEQKVFTRADCYLIKANEDLQKVLSENDYYLSEDIMGNYNVDHEIVPMSGISIKMAKSDKYQILKLQPKSFKKLFGSYELGAGASLFCLKEEELTKNEALMHGWSTTPEKMAHFFNDITKNNPNFYLNKSICESIKTFSSKAIKKLVDNSEEIQKKVFNGISLYEEPYPAHYFYHKDGIKKLSTIPFYVTTGSGRSHGDYTIVLKPISEF